LPALRELLDDMFPQPPWEPLNHLISITSKESSKTFQRLIGFSRQRILLINSLLPFFFSWAQLQQDKNLEKHLFALFLILPSEGANHKTKFMENRLFLNHPDFKATRNLSYHQGLIHLHDECCRSFYEGCRQCSLLRMLYPRQHDQ
ncbi:MAG: hypothetical protein COB67_12025, partial [SAR324 cluster bacterium]